jgi:hypothetical protein
MTDEHGNRAMLFPGKIPGYEKYFPDVERLNLAYFQSLDKKINYLNAQGFVPFIEVTRRDIGPAWHKYYPWPESYTRYIQYIYSIYLEPVSGEHLPVQPDSFRFAQQPCG